MERSHRRARASDARAFGFAFVLVVTACVPGPGAPPPRPTRAESGTALAGFLGDAISVEEGQFPAATVARAEDNQHFRTWVAVQPFRARLRYRAAVSVRSVEESHAAMLRPGWTITQAVRDGLLRSLLGPGLHPAGEEAWVGGEMLLERVDLAWRARSVDHRLPHGAWQ